MKRYFHSLAAAMILVLPLASCDKDNNGDDPTPTPTPNPTTPTAQLASIEFTEHNEYPDRFTFQYDESNKLKSVRSIFTYSFGDVGNFLAEFKWNPFSLTWNSQKINMTLSSSGYVTYIETGDHGDHTAYSTFEYDSKGHLIRSIRDDNNDPYVETTYKWENDLLTEIEVNSAGHQHSSTLLINISYGTELNITGVWPASYWIMCDFYIELDEGACPWLSQIGLLGVAPIRLPNSLSANLKSISNGDKQEGVATYQISNQLDSDGRLSYQSIENVSGTIKDNYTFKYTYR